MELPGQAWAEQPQVLLTPQPKRMVRPGRESPPWQGSESTYRPSWEKQPLPVVIQQQPQLNASEWRKVQLLSLTEDFAVLENALIAEQCWAGTFSYHYLESVAGIFFSFYTHSKWKTELFLIKKRKHMTKPHFITK